MRQQNVARVASEGNVPKPTARYGSLLEAIQLAYYQTRAVPCHSRELRDIRTWCLAQAEAQPALLETSWISDAKRAYVRAGGVPWEVLQDWIRAAMGEPIPPAARNARPMNARRITSLA